MSLEQGDSIETASAWPIEIRNTIGRRLIRALGQEMFFLKRFHCDPHPGNFAFRQDGSVIIYDYGSVKTLSNEIVQHFKRLVNAARHENIDLIETELFELHSLAEKANSRVIYINSGLKYCYVRLPPLIILQRTHHIMMACYL